MNTKCCKKCEKEISIKNKSGLCKVHREAAYRLDPAINATKKIAQKKCYEAKKQKYIQKSQEWYKNNKETKKNSVSLYRDSNRDWYKEYQKQYKEFNIDRINAKSRTHDNNKYQNNIAYYLKKKIRNRTNDALKSQMVNKPCSFTATMGCNGVQLIHHFESKFQPGMSWGNRYLWHIDHIRPLSSFDLSNKEQFEIACHYTNLQPLWAKDNLEKGAKWQN